MTSVRKILLVSAVPLILAIGYVAYVFNTCESVPTDYATRMVLEELKHRGMDPRFLSEPSESGCMVTYGYDSPTQKLSYAVIDDPMHGPELHSYDDNQDAGISEP